MFDAKKMWQIVAQAKLIWLLVLLILKKKGGGLVLPGLTWVFL